ncbi:MAG: S9 family peptidase [Zetaproteobacteria bacterium]|nr:S9 family peptidase [Zetaproteobacteria bacterium]
MNPPKATKIPYKLKAHHDIRIDEYYWLNQKNNQKVREYLEAENAYFKSQTKHTEDLKQSLFNEMKARIKEEDESTPYKKNGYNYVTKFKKGKQYPEYYRTLDVANATENLFLDVNLLAKDHKFYHVSGLSVSQNNRYLSFGVDINGSNQYTLCFKDLETGKLFKEKIKNTSGNAVWANDDKTVFYCKNNTKTFRTYQIYKHELNTHPNCDILIYEEADESFDVFVSKTKSNNYILFGTASFITTEYRYIHADKPNSHYKLFQKRQAKLEYSIEHYNDFFYILTNKDGAKNFKIMKTASNKTNKSNWQDLIPHRPEILLEDFSIFKNFMVLEERCNGLLQIRIISWDGKIDYYIPFNEETYTVYVAYNPEFETDEVRYVYQSLTTPSSVIDYNVITQQSTIVKAQEVLGGQFNKQNYTSKRLWATAKDGKKVPISMVHHKNTIPSSNTPLLLYVYGAYGQTIDDSFSTTLLSLLDRGFIYAIAHVRGGEYLGRPWYEAGKFLNKKNTFTDFVEVAKYLIANNYTSAKHLYAEGDSAGGLVMGAVINSNPELFNGIIAGVPFVDILTTMQDDSLPLTTGEYNEWGNPSNKKQYYYIKSYAPYDNVRAQNYPNLLVTSGFHDSQVQYFEPAKWVAKLRDLKTNNNKILFYVDMNLGHQGASGRFDSLYEVARDYCFMLDLENISQ